MFDTDGNGIFNRVEVQALLDAVGSNLPESVVEEFWSDVGKSSEASELTFDELFDAIETKITGSKQLAFRSSRKKSKRGTSPSPSGKTSLSSSMNGSVGLLSASAGSPSRTPSPSVVMATGDESDEELHVVTLHDCPIKDIPRFIEFHKLRTDEVLEPLDSFKTFNEFFYRKLKPGARKLVSPDDPTVVVAPADARTNVFPSVGDATRLWIKGRNFTLAKVLQDEKMAEYFAGGSVLVSRLAPQDYHRFHFPVDGVVGKTVEVSGAYFTVNPMAIRSAVD
ncbi:phosphatidylserine decarboxylase, partial [Gonapodya sp. JEL0774]